MKFLINDKIIEIPDNIIEAIRSAPSLAEIMAVQPMSAPIEEGGVHICMFYLSHADKNGKCECMVCGKETTIDSDKYENKS